MAFFTLLPDRAVLTLAGADRRSFLQGLITNDVAALSAGRALFAAFLTPQGKYLHDFILIENGDEILLDGEAARLEDLRHRLLRYRLRATVTLERATPPWLMAVVWGQGAAAHLGLAEKPAGTTAPFGSAALAAVDPRLARLGVRVLAARDPCGHLQQAGCIPARYEDWQRHRMALGVPQGSADLTPEKSLPLENGFDELNGIDWQKGCYLGQELTARTKYRGLIKKRLFPVHLPGAPPLPGTPVLRGESQVGEIRSALAGHDGTIALAMLALNTLAASDLRADDRPLTVLPPDWLNLD